MNVGFYVTVIRGKRVGYLVGPKPTEPEARDLIPAARTAAELVDPFTAFDLFGTARVERPGLLLAGVLNRQVEEIAC